MRRDELTSQEKILLSRIYKLDRQLKTFMENHQNMRMNKLLPQTDFIKKANDLYQKASPRVIDIAFSKTKYLQNLITIKKDKN